MSDPGLHSKFVEMQQEDRFASHYRSEDTVMTGEERGLRLSIARVKGEMNDPTLNPLRREALFKAMKELCWKLRKV